MGVCRFIIGDRRWGSYTYSTCSNNTQFKLNSSSKLISTSKLNINFEKFTLVIYVVHYVEIIVNMH